jgi:hypothetical protein
VQVALAHLRATVNRMHMRILKPWREQPVTDVDHLGGWPSHGSHLGV